MTIPLNESRLSLARSGVLLLLAAASVIAYLTRHSLAVANTTIQKELGINNEHFGQLYSAFSLGYMFFQIPGGWFGQRIGVRWALPLMAILWSLTTFATAFVATFAGLIVVRFLFGLAQAGLVPNQALVVRDWMSDTGRGVASSVMVVAMSVGSIASMALTSWLLKHWPWRSIFIGYSTIGIVWAVIFAVVFRASPQSVRWLHLPTDDEAHTDSLYAPELASPASPSQRIPKQASLSLGPSPALAMLTSRSMWGLSIQAMLKAAGYNLAVTFLPALLEYIHRVPPQKTGSLVTVSLTTFIIGSTLGGMVVDLAYRITGSKYVSRSGIAAAMLGLAAMFTSFAGFAESADRTAAWLAIGAFFSGLASAAPWVAVMDIGGKNTAVIMGFMNSFAALGGVLLSPLVGRLIDHTKATNGDWSLVFLLHGAYYLISGVAWLIVNPNQTLEPAGETDAV